MIVSEKSHQNLSDNIQFLFKKKIEFIKKQEWFLVKKLEIQVIISTIMLIRSSERIFNPSRYTGIYIYIYIYAPQYKSYLNENVILWYCYK